MKYLLDEKPNFKAMLLYGIQWFIITIPSIIIIGSVVSKLHNSDTAYQIMYMQKLFMVTGLITVLQIFFGHKLPLVVGPASVLLVSIIATISAGEAAIYTAIMVGGVTLSIVAYTGALRKLQKLFTPRIIAVILMLIAITLLPSILKLILDNGQQIGWKFLIAMLLVIGIIIGNNLLKGVWKSTTLLWAILVGCFIYFIFFGFPSVNQSNTMLSFDTLILPSIDFNAGVLLSFVFSYIALIINEIGSIESIGHLLEADQLDKRVTKGVGLLGFSNFFSGSLGVIGTVDFSMSSGVIASTGCASRYTLVPAGIGLMLCALFPSIIAILLCIPSLIMGVLLLYLMSIQLAAALQMLITSASIKNMTHGLTIALPIMVAILIAFAPETFKQAIPALIRPIINNGFVMGTITVIILEHLVFRTKKL